MQTIHDLIFGLIDLGHEFGIEPRKTRKVKASKLIKESLKRAERASRKEAEKKLWASR